RDVRKTQQDDSALRNRMPQTPPNGLHPLGELYPAYRCQPGHYDELLSGSVVRPHYQRLLGIEPRLDGSQLYLRWQNIKRSLRENPSSSSGQFSKADGTRSWELDPIPFVIPESDWKKLSEGVEQRVRLIDALLQDVYGSQKHIKSGAIPTELVFGTDSFLRPMQSAQVRERMLYLYAAQIARNSSGQWMVIADRTQGPSGGGLAVENRLAISRVLETDFRQMKVLRLASFFAALRDELNPSGRRKERSVRNVLLSPGVASQTFFEDAYLARYLGYTLTQASDLTVRGGSVFLKTLGGLVGVDSILRRIPDIDCDPLELNTSSPIGIPGLCQASRDQQVRLANQLGSGWAESPALTAILPELCQTILGEDLKLGNAPMRWCGRPDNVEAILREPERYVIRNSFCRHSRMDWDFQSASDESKAKFKAELLASPWSFVALEKFKPSCAPTWHANRVVAWPTVIRVFAAATNQGFEVMPGGIARSADNGDALSESLISGQLSKDVWVLTSSKVKPVSLLTPTKVTTEVRRNAMDLPSRVAEHFFWLGRQTERAEGMVRHARLCVSKLEGGLTESPPPDMSGHTEEMRKELVEFLFSDQRLNALTSSLRGIRFNAESIRDRLSFDSWQLLSRLDLDVLIPWVDRRQKIGDAGVFINQMTTLLSAFAGLVSENMTRGPGWAFLDLGRRIERAFGLLRLLDLLLVPGGRSIAALAESALEICDSSMTYRYRYLMNYEVAPTLDLLLFDPANPRSVTFQFVKIVDLLEGLTGASSVDVTLQRRAMMDARGMMRLFDAESLSVEVESSDGKPPKRAHLEKLLNDLVHSLNSLVDFLCQRFLTHTVAARQLQDAANQ
ncbi:MAG: circularly permuted type 2 ATP-grasp protein, partial [Pirellula sp.]|nr:circularly permuted type 2 ATP-grasp protein [Pirellula sp.]